MGMQLIIRWRVLGLAVVLLMVLSACSPIVIIPDNALESAIRAEIRKPLSLFLTRRDLNGVRKLDVSNYNLKIASLEGLQFCVNMNDLNLTNNQVSDISQLRNMTQLVRLHLGDNQIMDIEAIAGLLSLEYLDLSGDGNAITDWRHLEANVLNGGLTVGALVKVPRTHTFDGSGKPLAGFAGAYNAMLDAGVNVDTGEALDN